MTTTSDNQVWAYKALDGSLYETPEACAKRNAQIKREKIEQAIERLFDKYRRVRFPHAYSPYAFSEQSGEDNIIRKLVQDWPNWAIKLQELMND